MIHLYENDRYTEHRASSKGNQLKFRRGDFWYKADFTGYEGLTEYTVSKLLGHREIATTQIYAHLVDARKQEAVSRITHIFDNI